MPKGEKTGYHLQHYKNGVMVKNKPDTNDGVFIFHQVGHFGGREMDNIAIAPCYESDKTGIMWKQKWKNRMGKRQKEFHIVSFPVSVAEEVARAILRACGAEETVIDYKKKDENKEFERFADDFLP